MMATGHTITAFAITPSNHPSVASFFTIKAVQADLTSLLREHSTVHTSIHEIQCRAAHQAIALLGGATVDECRVDSSKQQQLQQLRAFPIHTAARIPYKHNSRARQTKSRIFYLTVFAAIA